jgi:hypothetical protein
MGEFLSTPNKEKISEDGENSFVICYFLILGKIWGMRDAGLEEKDGGFSHI